MNEKINLVWAIYALAYKLDQDAINKDEFVERSLKCVNEVFSLTDVSQLLTEYEKFASGDNYIGSKEIIDKQIKEFIEVNCG